MYNQTFVDSCTYATCSVEEYGQIRYIPSLAGNLFYLSMFGLCLLCQFILGIRYKTWGYLGCMFGGLLLEILGYVARVQLHYDVFDEQKFTAYLIGTTIGPAFFSAVIYLCLARIIPVYGSDFSPLKPRTITCAFVLCDFISLILQAVGGAMTATAETPDNMQTGIDIMIAGLASQVASMTVFVYLCGHFAWNIYKNPSSKNPNTNALRTSFKFRLFLYTIAIATITILIRCCFRVAELHEGYEGALANDEVLYMVLEGAMMTCAVLALTAGHPGPAMGTTVWKANGFRLRSRRTAGAIGGESEKYTNDSPA